MEDSKAGRPSRWVALLLVLAVHVGLIAGLVVSSRTQRLLISMTNPIELLFLPPAAPHRVRLETPVSQPWEKIRAAASADAALTVAPNDLLAPDWSGLRIDWAGTAHTVAAAIAAEMESRENPSMVASTPPTKSIFAGRPVHRAGEQFKTDSGEWIVFISDGCYQLANSPPKSPMALENGMAQPTYCVGVSHAARGDLFDWMPAYQKYHPR